MFNHLNWNSPMCSFIWITFVSSWICFESLFLCQGHLLCLSEIVLNSGSVFHRDQTTWWQNLTSMKKKQIHQKILLDNLAKSKGFLISFLLSQLQFQLKLVSKLIPQKPENRIFKKKKLKMAKTNSFGNFRKKIQNSNF